MTETGDPGGDGTTRRLGTCPLCEAMCGLAFTVSAGRITSVRGDAKDPLSRGHLCPKATALGDLHTDPDRLRRPLIRHGDTWRESSWDDALALVHRRLGDIRTRHGRDAVAVYWGNPVAHNLGGLTHGIGGLLPELGTRNVFSATSLDSRPHLMVHRALYGHQLLAPVPDLDRTDHLLLFGSNPLVSNGSMMAVPNVGQRLRDLRARGGRLVVVDPRRTRTAAAADEYVTVRPGTDAFLLLAMIRTILEDGAATPASYVDGLGELAAVVAPFAPDRVAPLTGVPAETVARLARDFAAASRAAAHGRMGVSTQRAGGLCQWAIHVLNIVTANLDRPGGTLIPHPAADLVATDSMKAGESGRWRTRVRGLPEFGGELPSAALAEELAHPDRPIRALVVIAGNPVLSAPGGDRVRDAVAGLDFVVAVDPYRTETTRLADVILPPTSAVQREQVDVFHAHLAVRNTVRVNGPILPRAADERHDWEIYRDLALGLRRRTPRRARHPRWWLRGAMLRLTPMRTLALLLAASRRGVSMRRLRTAPHGLDLGPLEPSLPGRLRTPNRRIPVVPQVFGDAARTLAGDLDARRDPTELLLIGRRHLRSTNSWMNNLPRLTKGAPRHRLQAHPDDLATRGLVDGDSALLTSAHGSVTVEVEATDEVAPGVVSLPHGYGRDRGDGLTVAAALGGPNVNEVTDPARVDPVTGTAVLNGVPVTLTRDLPTPTGAAD
ncbi:molybdopterin-dependent oxidoreductase [Rhodococcoides corynebacterioides]|uniref:molybdopterin-dependent oxidoreductase n=1 Tax=Rhodococcoides corynebacterioides TaxID=53972 RepID=UPI003F80BA8A